MQSTEQTRAHAQDILDYIDSHPEQHDQRFFFGRTGCGTTMCIAGTSAWLTYGDAATSTVVGEVGQEMLGLDGGEAEIIFFEMSNSRAIDKLKKIAQGIPFDRNDFYTNESAESEDYFKMNPNDYHWDLHLKAQAVLDKAQGSV